MAALGISGWAQAADDARSKAMRDYYRALKGAATAEERQTLMKQGYPDRVGAAAIAEQKKNTEEFKRKRPLAPTHKSTKKRTPEERKKHREQKEQAKKKRGKGNKPKPSAASEPAPRAPIPESPSYSREEVVIDGKDVPKELEFPGKPSTPPAAPTGRPGAGSPRR